MPTTRDQIDLAYRLLDLDLIDSEGIRCGKVDDLELAGKPGEATYVSAIRTGYGALPPRFIRPLRRPARRIFGSSHVDVPAKLVDDFDAAVTLSVTAAELGLGKGDRRLGNLFDSGGSA
jgi:sporulation protein YlmC with PRC-barrel domain